MPEYTATIAYALLREGKEGRHKVDSVKIVLKAEGMSSNNFNDITNFFFITNSGIEHLCFMSLRSYT